MQWQDIEASEVTTRLKEFADLNRRRLFGRPPLDVEEMERWLELRHGLERHFSGGRAGVDWEGRERREFLRLDTHLHVRFGDDDALTGATATDISQGGVFIATPRLLARGCLVRLEFDGGDEPFHLSAIVSWQRPPGDRGGPAGMGLVFTDVDGAARSRISRLVEQAARPD